MRFDRIFLPISHAIPCFIEISFLGPKHAYRVSMPVACFPPPTTKSLASGYFRSLVSLLAAAADALLLANELRPS